ncbi:MAG: lipocalin family protein [Bacteroidota bacterium]
MYKSTINVLRYIIIILIFSCSKTNANNDSQIVGKWMEFSATPASNYSACDFQGSYIDLKSDNSYSEYSKCSNKITGGTYSKVGNTIVVTSSAFPIPVTLNIITLTSTDLILEDTFMGSTDRVTYKR